MRIAFFGDGHWATESLDLILQAGHEVPVVVLRTRPSGDSLRARASELGITIRQPEKVNAPEFVAEIAAFAPELNLSVSYDQILRAAIRESAPLGFVNVHAGLLPLYRGRNIINWAIINGENEIGLTCHFVDDGIDTGDIIMQKRLPLGPHETYADVLARMTAAVPELTSQAVNSIADGSATRTVQSHQRGTYYPSRKWGDEWLNWSLSGLNVYNFIRGITRPAPGARTLLGDVEWIVWAAEFDETWPKYRATPGEVVGTEPDGSCYVKTGDSVVRITEVQKVGEESAGPPRWRIGTRLGLNPIDALVQAQRRISELEAIISSRSISSKEP